MKSKLYLALVVLGICFLFLALQVNYLVREKVYQQVPDGASNQKYISFFNGSDSDQIYHPLSTNVIDIIKSTDGVKLISSYQSLPARAGINPASLDNKVIALVSENFFMTLGVDPLIGNYASKSNDVLLSYNYARQMDAGLNELIGKRIIFGDSSAIISGILPKDFSGIGEKIDFYLSEEIYHKSLNNSFIDQPEKWQESILRADTNKFVFGIIENQSSLDSLEGQINPVLSNYQNTLTFKTSNGEDAFFSFMPEKSIEIKPGVILKPNKQRKIVELMEPLQLVIILLFVSTLISYIYYQLSTLPNLQKTMGVKMVCGIHVKSVFFEFLSRAVLPLFIALLISYPLTKLLVMELNNLSIFSGYLDTVNSIDYSLGIYGVFLVLLLSFVTSTVSTIYTYKKLDINMTSKVSASNTENFIRSISMSVLFAFGMIVMYFVVTLSKDINSHLNKDRGYESENVFLFKVNSDDLSSDYANLLDSLSNALSAPFAAYDDLPPIDSSQRTTIDLGGSKSAGSDLFFVTSNFQKVLQLDMVSGNFFSTELPAGIIISDTLLKKLGLTEQTAIGKQVFIDVFGSKMPQSIIGVSKELDDTSGNIFINSYNPNSLSLDNNKFLLKHTGPKAEIQNEVKSILNGIGWQLVYFDSFNDVLRLENSSKVNVLKIATVLSLGIFILMVTTIVSHVNYDLNIREKERKIKSVFGATPMTQLFEILIKYLNIVAGGLLLFGLISYFLFATFNIQDNLTYLETPDYLYSFLTVVFVSTAIVILLIAIMSIKDSLAHKEIKI